MAGRKQAQQTLLSLVASRQHDPPATARGMESHQRITGSNCSGEIIMELLERYLQAVRFWLPRSQQHDMIEELRDDLRSQIEDREAELGRTLNDAELQAIIRQCGPPMLVASRYLPQT